MTSKTQAIQTALTGDWTTAVSLNLEILKENPEDIETLNRLAFAYTVLGKVKEAKKTYQKVLQVDFQNPIALKNLKRLSNSCETVEETNDNSQRSTFFATDINSVFIEETGKTKVIELVNIADSKIIANLMVGELLKICIKRLRIFILGQKDQYIGMLPDDLGIRLIKFLKGGNNYQVVVKAVENKKVIIFIRETVRSAKFKNQPSFALWDKNKATISNKPYVSPRLEDDSKEDED
ncbi:hypothetical protein C4559_04920 [Candidatus Microgenomates bacterium]|nr:MAG: hypothetical protein C4559_04920 [Candidatus Microgenomates bacterium]